MTVYGQFPVAAVRKPLSSESDVCDHRPLLCALGGGLFQSEAQGEVVGQVAPTRILPGVFPVPAGVCWAADQSADEGASQR